jgi:hypothetical protein
MFSWRKLRRRWLTVQNKLELTQGGRTEVFGSLDMLMLQKSAEERVGKLLPEALEQLSSHKGMAEHCKPVLGVVVDFCVRAFAQHEKTIHELEKKVRRLHRGQVQTQVDAIWQKPLVLEKCPSPV